MPKNNQVTVNHNNGFEISFVNFQFFFSKIISDIKMILIRNCEKIIDQY